MEGELLGDVFGGKTMDIIKICFNQEKNTHTQGLDAIVEQFRNRGCLVHSQELNNTPYLQWLKGLNVMPWRYIIDLYDSNDAHLLNKVVNDLPDVLQGFDCDVYRANQMTYKNPVNHAELITSCYFWNTQNSSLYRHKKMHEHFLMEQAQKYYDYVAFQCVTEVITPHSPKYDFFFEAHVTETEGINEIYSKPALTEMRTHSIAFLDVNSRLLSFGRVICDE